MTFIGQWSSFLHQPSETFMQQWHFLCTL